MATKKKAAKKTTRATKARKTATPDQIKEAQHDESRAEHVAERLRGEGVDAHAHHGVPEVEVHNLTASEIATAEAKDAGLKIFQITSKPPADADTMYFAAVDNKDAQDELFVHCGTIPNELIEIVEVDALPDGEIFANDVIAKRDELRGKETQIADEIKQQPSVTPGEENSQGERNDLGNTPAAQKDMDAVAAAHDDALLEDTDKNRSDLN